MSDLTSVPRGRRRRRVVIVDMSAIARNAGARIRAARLAVGLTQRQLADGRYTGAYISALEAGKAKPSVAALAHIAGRLGVEPGELLSSEAPASIPQAVVPARLWLADDRIYFEMKSGLQIGVPTRLVPMLERGSLRDLAVWEIDPRTRMVRWPRLNAEIDLARLFRRAGIQLTE